MSAATPAWPRPAADLTPELAWSALGHAILFATLYALLVARERAPVTIDLDLSQAPRMPAVTPHRPSRPAAAKSWTAPLAGLAPAPAGATEAAEHADPLTTCPPPCPETPGAYVPAQMAAAAPRWIAGFITDGDYPKLARQQGQDGRVLLSVFIQADGTVRDVKLLQGSYDALNRVALAKVRAARFEPARDESGRPIPSKLLLPIRFELK